MFFGPSRKVLGIGMHNDSQRAGLCAGLDVLTSSPELPPNKITEVEGNNKSSIVFRPAPN
jgi:hypothetical protein